MRRAFTPYPPSRLFIVCWTRDGQRAGSSGPENSNLGFFYPVRFSSGFTRQFWTRNPAWDPDFGNSQPVPSPFRSKNKMYCASWFSIHNEFRNELWKFGKNFSMTISVTDKWLNCTFRNFEIECFLLSEERIEWRYVQLRLVKTQSSKINFKLFQTPIQGHKKVILQLSDDEERAVFTWFNEKFPNSGKSLNWKIMARGWLGEKNEIFTFRLF